MCSRDEQSFTSSDKEQFIDGCSKKEKSNNTTCTKKIEDKNCQAEKSDMQPKKPKKDIQSNELAMLIQHKMSKKQILLQADNKNCQSTEYYEPNKDQVKSMSSDKKCQDNKSVNMWPVKSPVHMWSVTRSGNKKSIGSAKNKNCQDTTCECNDSKSQSSRCSDKNCQENENINMQSMTNTDNIWLPKPAVPYLYSRMCKDKDCQSTRCYKKRNCDKNCQSV